MEEGAAKAISFSTYLDERTLSNPGAAQLEQPENDRRARRARARAQDLQLGVIVRYPPRTGCGP